MAGGILLKNIFLLLEALIRSGLEEDASILTASFGEVVNSPSNLRKTPLKFTLERNASKF